MKNGLFIFAMGFASSVISCWSVGCANHGSYEHFSQSAANKGAQNAQSAESGEPTAGAEISGTWNCVDDSCSDAIVTISSDLSAMTRNETLRDSSGAQICRIEEPFELKITDETDPDRVQATVSGGAPILVPSAQNSLSCEALIKDIGQQPPQNQPETFERNEGGILMIDGQRFRRAQES